MKILDWLTRKRSTNGDRDTRLARLEARTERAEARVARIDPRRQAARAEEFEARLRHVLLRDG
jgi:hypothetical protein